MLKFTEKLPLSVRGVSIQLESTFHPADVQLYALMIFRLIYELTELIVKRKPRDIYRTVTDRQLVLDEP